METRTDYLESIEKLLQPEYVNSFLVHVATNKEKYEKNINHIISYLMYKYNDKSELLSKLKVLLLTTPKADISNDSNSDSDEDDSLYKMGTNETMEKIFYTVLDIKNKKYEGDLFEDSLDLLYEDSSLYKNLVIEFFKNIDFYGSDVDGMIIELCDALVEIYEIDAQECSNDISKSNIKNLNYLEDEKKKNLIKSDEYDLKKEKDESKKIKTDNLNFGNSINQEEIVDGKTVDGVKKEFGFVQENSFFKEGTSIIKNIDDEDSEVLEFLDKSVQNQLKGLKYEKLLKSESFKKLTGNKIIRLIEILIEKNIISNTKLMNKMFLIDPICRNLGKNNKALSRTVKLFFKKLAVKNVKKLQKKFFKAMKKYPNAVDYYFYVQNTFKGTNYKYDWKKMFKIIADNSFINLNFIDHHLVPGKLVYKTLLRADKPLRFKNLLNNIIKTEFDDELLEKYVLKFKESELLKDKFKSSIEKMENRIKELKQNDNK